METVAVYKHFERAADGVSAVCRYTSAKITPEQHCRKKTIKHCRDPHVTADAYVSMTSG